LKKLLNKHSITFCNNLGNILSTIAVNTFSTKPFSRSCLQCETINAKYYILKSYKKNKSTKLKLNHTVQQMKILLLLILYMFTQQLPLVLIW